MELIGFVKKFTKTKSGISQRTGKEWKSRQMVVEVNNGFSVQEIAFDVFNETLQYNGGTNTLKELIDAGIIKQGQAVKIHFSLRSTMSTKDGKETYFTSASAYKVEMVSAPSAMSTSPAPAPAATASVPPNTPPPSNDDLPF